MNPTWKYFGSTSKKQEKALKQYLKKDCLYRKQDGIGNKDAIKPQTLERMFSLKYMNSLINPGENVGTLAGQGIGEPST